MLINMRNGLMAGKRLPYKRRVEYIYSNGNQFIKPGLYADSDMKFECAGLNSSSRGVFFGSYDGMSGFCAPYNPSDWCYFGGTERVRGSTSQMTLNAYHEMSMSKAGLFIDGTLITSTIANAQNKTSTIEFFVNGWNNRGRRECSGAMRMYYFRVSKAGKYILNLTPVIDLNDVSCMYDEVSNTNFYNAGTGFFVAGPDAT